jgi:hypothetical protein
MRSDWLLGLLLAGALAGPAAAGARKVERLDVTTLKPTGEPVRCLTRRDVQTRPAGEQAVMARVGANRWYRNDLRGRCPQMTANRTLVFRSTSSQLCELDTFRVVDLVSGIDSGVCVLGPFTPVDVPRGATF